MASASLIGKDQNPSLNVNIWWLGSLISELLSQLWKKTVKMIHGLLNSHEDAVIKLNIQHASAEQLIFHFI